MGRPRKSYLSAERIRELLDSLKYVSYDEYNLVLDDIRSPEELTGKQLHELDKAFLSGTRIYIKGAESLKEKTPPHLANAFEKYLSVYREYKNAVGKRLVSQSKNAPAKMDLITYQEEYEPILKSFEDYFVLLDSSKRSKDSLLNSIRAQLRTLKKQEPRLETRQYKDILDECKRHILGADIQTQEGRDIIELAENQYRPLFEDMHREVFGKPLKTFKKKTEPEQKEPLHIDITIDIYSGFKP